MSGEHPPTVLTPLYRLLEGHHLIPGFWQNHPQGERLFEVFGFAFLTALFLVVSCWIISRSLKRIPGRLQSILEVSVESLAGMVESLIGPGGRKYLPLLGSLFLFIFCLNLMGLIPGFMSPTANWNCNIALALVVIVFVQAMAIRANGLGGYLKHFAGSPTSVLMWCLAPMMFPLHLLGELVKPVSLSLRLFGNIYGEDTIILSMVDISKTATIGGVPLPLPIPMMAFAIFTSFLQAFIFTALSCIYIMIMTAHTEEH